MQRGNSMTSFEHAAKKRQAWFREFSSTISPRGCSPSDGKGERNPHFLALGCEEENLYPGIRCGGGAIEFFSQRGIQWWKSSRSGDDVNGTGPTRNMASSQVACVNFLLPLAGIPGALLSALSAIDDDVRGIVDIHHEGNTSSVEFEWIGVGRSLEGGRTRGAQNTSIDAFLVVETQSGRRRAYLLEWKFAEQYLRTRPEFKGKGKSGETRRKEIPRSLPRRLLLLQSGSRSQPGRIPLRALLSDHAAATARRSDDSSARAGRRRGQGGGDCPRPKPRLPARYRWRENDISAVDQAFPSPGNGRRGDACRTQGRRLAVRHGGAVHPARRRSPQTL